MQNHILAPRTGNVAQTYRTTACRKDIRLLYRAWREQISRLERRQIRLSATQKREMLRDFCRNVRALDRSCRLLQA
ncbi:MULTISPECIES: hypothetical protein [Asaia]|uniref:hypothetical protein n=1 Tax=Asaia TaxID=91914 RepID=UPI002FC27AFB